MNKKKFLLLLPIFLTTSCGGYSLSYLVEGSKYNSPVFEENYYRHFDEEFKDAKEGVNKEVTIYSFEDLFKIDPKVYDKYESSSKYAEEYKMNSVDDMFNYGVQSKLFDGQMVCGAQNDRPELAYQLARIQADTKGFSVRFSKESDELSYFAMQFKATTDTTKETYILNSDEIASSESQLYHNSTVDIALSIYTKDENDIVKNTFKFSKLLENTNNGGAYTFIAFDLKEYNLSRMIGLSISYEYNDELINWNKTKDVDLDYALFLYEMFMPYTNWH